MTNAVEINLTLNSLRKEENPTYIVITFGNRHVENNEETA